MHSVARSRAWLAWAIPVLIGSLVAAYEVFNQVALNPDRARAVFLLELFLFGGIGPALGGLLLRRLLAQQAAGWAAAERIGALQAAERERRVRASAGLHAISSALMAAPSEDEALAGALEQLISALQLDRGRVFLLDEDGRLTLVAAKGAAGETDAAAQTCPCRLDANKGAAYRVDDLPQVWRDGCRRDPLATCAVAPLLAREHPLGVLQVATLRPGALDEADVALLRSIGAQIGVAVENMRLREEARRAEGLTTLIQEMHHRIKNNLQTVADLLSLEMSASPSPVARKSLRDSISRIKSIAAVHELLSLEQLRLTDITELARQVCDISLRHLVRPDQRVEMAIDGPAIYLPSKQATALALVMNELVANALEHAFSLASRRGRIEISLAQDGPCVTVSISDNGRGLPPGFDLGHARGLGLQIARTLVEKDLAGTLQLANRPEGGSRATLVFYK